jgi:hypothetical protein
MIGMLVRDEDRVQALGVLADRDQPFASLLEAQARVDKQPRPLGGHKSGVPRAAAGECADSNDNRLRSYSLVTEIGQNNKGSFCYGLHGLGGEQ